MKLDSKSLVKLVKTLLLAVSLQFSISQSAEAAERILVSAEKLLCVGDNASDYLSAIGDGPALIFLDFCPGNEPDADTISSLATALDPDLTLGSDESEQTFVSMTASEIECISTEVVRKELRTFDGLVDLVTLLEERCGL